MRKNNGIQVRRMNELTEKRSLLIGILILLFSTVVCSQTDNWNIQFSKQRKLMTMTRKPCQDGEGNMGVCMFKWDCISQDGTTLSTCADGFLFGACCKLRFHVEFSSKTPSTSVNGIDSKFEDANMYIIEDTLTQGESLLPNMNSKSTTKSFNDDDNVTQLHASERPSQTNELFALLSLDDHQFHPANANLGEAFTDAVSTTVIQHSASEMSSEVTASFLNQANFIHVSLSNVNPTVPGLPFTNEDQHTKDLNNVFFISSKQHTLFSHSSSKGFSTPLASDSNLWRTTSRVDEFDTKDKTSIHNIEHTVGNSMSSIASFPSIGTEYFSEKTTEVSVNISPGEEMVKSSNDFTSLTVLLNDSKVSNSNVSQDVGAKSERDRERELGNMIITNVPNRYDKNSILQRTNHITTQSTDFKLISHPENEVTQASGIFINDGSLFDHASISTDSILPPVTTKFSISQLLSGNQHEDTEKLKAEETGDFTSKSEISNNSELQYPSPLRLSTLSHFTFNEKFQDISANIPLTDIRVDNSYASVFNKTTDPMQKVPRTTLSGTLFSSSSEQKSNESSLALHGETVEIFSEVKKDVEETTTPITIFISQSKTSRIGENFSQHTDSEASSVGGYTSPKEDTRLRFTQEIPLKNMNYPEPLTIELLSVRPLMSNTEGNSTNITTPSVQISDYVAAILSVKDKPLHLKIPSVSANQNHHEYLEDNTASTIYVDSSEGQTLKDSSSSDISITFDLEVSQDLMQSDVKDKLGTTNQNRFTITNKDHTFDVTSNVSLLPESHLETKGNVTEPWVEHTSNSEKEVSTTVFQEYSNETLSKISKEMFTDISTITNNYTYSSTLQDSSTSHLPNMTSSGGSNLFEFMEVGSQTIAIYENQTNPELHLLKTIHALPTIAYQEATEILISENNENITNSNFFHVNGTEEQMAELSDITESPISNGNITIVPDIREDIGTTSQFLNQNTREEIATSKDELHTTNHFLSTESNFYIVNVHDPLSNESYQMVTRQNIWDSSDLVTDSPTQTLDIEEVTNLSLLYNTLTLGSEDRRPSTQHDETSTVPSEIMVTLTHKPSLSDTETAISAVVATSTRTIVDLVQKSSTENPDEKTTLQGFSSTTRWDYKNDCGVRLLRSSGRIVGGQNTFFGKWPWQALVKEATWLGIFIKNKCGGVLINSKYVITAAHCQPGFLSTLLVVLGAHDLTRSNEGLRPVAITRNVKRMVVHRNYNSQTFENDLALLEMDWPIQFLPHVVPICLPHRSEDFTGKMAFVTGWGKLTHGGDVPNILQEAQVPIVNNDECQRMYYSAGHDKMIRNHFMCAGYRSGGQDSCEGDSGGPLVVQRDDSRWVLVGTVSHGIGCADPNLPGVYMRMSAYRHWIDSIINKS